MTQDQWIVLCLKAGLVAGFAALVAWVVAYSHLTRRDAWRNPIGKTLIVETLLNAGLFVPTALSLFFHLSRLNSYVVAWSDVALIGAVAPAMAWRTLVWVRLDRLGRLPRNGNDREGDPGGAG